MCRLPAVVGQEVVRPLHSGHIWRSPQLRPQLLPLAYTPTGPLPPPPSAWARRNEHYVNGKFHFRPWLRQSRLVGSMGVGGKHRRGVKKTHRINWTGTNDGCFSCSHFPAMCQLIPRGHLWVFWVSPGFAWPKISRRSFDIDRAMEYSYYNFGRTVPLSHMRITQDGMVSGPSNKGKESTGGVLRTGRR
jgi:hypothetical protein